MSMLGILFFAGLFNAELEDLQEFLANIKNM